MTGPPDSAYTSANLPDNDPTRNVLLKVEDAVQRLDDLRVSSERRGDELRMAAVLLNDTKHSHVKDIMSLTADHAQQLNEAETKRIDAIRAVDVAAVGIATERAAAAATVLANQVSTSAETLRALVASTAAASAAQYTATFGQLSDRIAQLERTSYEGSGKSAMADPQFARMAESLELLRSSMAGRVGREGLSQPLLMTLVAGGAALAVFVIENMMRGAGVQ